MRAITAPSTLTRFMTHLFWDQCGPHLKWLGVVCLPLLCRVVPMLTRLLLVCLAAAGPPGGPEGLEVTDITDTTVKLSWGSGPDNHSPVTMYMVQARTAFSIGWQSVRTGNGCINEIQFRVPIIAGSHQFKQIRGCSLKRVPLFSASFCQPSI